MSLKQIAAIAGASVSTVSRVLNNTSSSCASKELQDKIWAAAREIGYQPNQAARALKKGSGETVKLPRIAVVMPQSPFPALPQTYVSDTIPWPDWTAQTQIPSVPQPGNRTFKTGRRHRRYGARRGHLPEEAIFCKRHPYYGQMLPYAALANSAAE